MTTDHHPDRPRPGDVFVNADFGYNPRPTSPTSATWCSSTPTRRIGQRLGLRHRRRHRHAYPRRGRKRTWTAGDIIIATDVTDADGLYLFPDVSTLDGTGTDDYLVWVNDTAGVLAGTVPTVDPDGVRPVTNLAATDLNQDFGYTAPGQTSGNG